MIEQIYQFNEMVCGAMFFFFIYILCDVRGCAVMKKTYYIHKGKLSSKKKCRKQGEMLRSLMISCLSADEWVLNIYILI